jgi:hypothetical protein
MNKSQSLLEMLQNGIPSNYHFSGRDAIDGLHPFEIPFYLNDETKKVVSALLHYKINRISEASGEYIADYEPEKDFINICIDGEAVTAISDLKGNIDLTQWITTSGWHEIKLSCRDYVEMKWQLNIRSFTE